MRHLEKFSPRSWRCFSRIKKPCQNVEVFSTFVEVFLYYYTISRGTSCFLHVRGGVSVAVPEWWYDEEFSPRSWRCFSPIQSFFSPPEVFPGLWILTAVKPSFLHVRGGVSTG